MNRRIRTVARVTFIVAFVVVVLGAFVRLSHAGLGCPDWPVCYGKLTWPNEASEIAQANMDFPERPVEYEKAWKEQVHRLLASLLGLLILSLAWMAAPIGKRRWVAASAAAVTAGTFAYVAGWPTVSALTSGTGLLVVLVCWFMWSQHRLARFCFALFGVVVVQAMLGMWTVTWKLLPLVVTLHLMGGMLTLSLLFWLATRPLSRSDAFSTRKPTPTVLIAAIVVVVSQIALGGWVSSNYAAVACPDFPTCQLEWVPKADYVEGFTLFREIGVDYEGGELDHDARVAIHFTHRIGAIFATVFVLMAAIFLWMRRYKPMAVWLIAVLSAQIALGIGNVVLGLPLAVAVAHNAVAALLLLSLLWAVRRTTL